jgi:two-component system sensor histidine kinase KdpD
MGIGLSVCHTVVAAHGGTIRGENTGNGARFTVELPLEEGDTL